MLDLALYADAGPVLRQDMADRQEISPEYIAQLFRHLSKAGLVESIMGPGGGYRLARDPRMIRIGDIFRAVEGPVAAVACVLTDEGSHCSRTEHCAARLLWVQLSQVIESYLDSITLEQLCEVARQIEIGEHPGCQDTASFFVNTISHWAPDQTDCDQNPAHQKPDPIYS